MTITDKDGNTMYKGFAAKLDPEGWNWYENRNGTWGLSGFSIFLNGGLDAVVFNAIGKRGKELRGGFAVEAQAFVDVVVRFLAHLWDIPADDIRNIQAFSEKVERCEKAVDILLNALPDPDIFSSDDDTAIRIREAEALLSELYPEEEGTAEALPFAEA